MAAREPCKSLAGALPRALVPKPSPRLWSLRYNSTAQASQDSPTQAAPAETTSTSTPLTPEEIVKNFDPIKQANSRKTQLPRSRYQYRSPKYYRGPLHPHQPPRPSDPASRLFVPGPFSLPRSLQTYDSTIAQDIMTLCYVHYPPGFKPPPKGQRLRSWDDSSPYHKNRPLRGPRGGDVLRLIRKPITFRNIPAMERITVHSYIKQAATEGSHWLHVAGMAIQAITNVRVQTYKSKTGVAPWGISPGKNTVAVKVELTGENMHHFLSKLVEIVLPKIKEWKGIPGTSGDSSGNITFGLKPEEVALFPEIEVNYDMYPSNMIPGCHITLHTSARTDKDARLLLSALGFPFHGKLVD
ncbi:hypothetical protein VTN31DRAFT_7302 [Thermomyces dupontii]|uniref:mitochondrial 54S ribosomal protein uL5m n=1 Tax=Talaromyces thermophilus TaxID=28565 RepID=UPI0037435E53